MENLRELRTGNIGQIIEEADAVLLANSDKISLPTGLSDLDSLCGISILGRSLIDCISKCTSTGLTITAVRATIDVWIVHLSQCFADTFVGHVKSSVDICELLVLNSIVSPWIGFASLHFELTRTVPNEVQTILGKFVNGDAASADGDHTLHYDVRGIRVIDHFRTNAHSHGVGTPFGSICGIFAISIEIFRLPSHWVCWIENDGIGGGVDQSQ
mmetsp:Transcript_5419/g.11617  ORF Transcript_5419/g.11617 Transcript_5419/m.11617 type:complete len:214 (-) Transcript_5419:1152-1793(-)